MTDPQNLRDPDLLDQDHHAVALDDGRTLADGPPETIRDNPELIPASIGAAPAELAA